MKTQPVSLSVEHPALFVSQCGPCPRAAWCHKSADRLCRVSEDHREAERYWRFQRDRVEHAGGVAPKGLPPVRLQPRLAKVTHIVGREPFDSRRCSGQEFGVYARDTLGPLREGFRIRPRALEKRGLLSVPTVLVISDRDDWLQDFYHFVGEPFAESVQAHNFTAVIGPNLSAYHHVEHYVWLDNRALCQQFTGFALKRGLPAIFHTYLEDSPIHQDWLVEYLKLNPTQKFIATGFDRNAGNNGRFVKRRIKLLEAVERRAGRQLFVVLHTLMTRLNYIRMAHDAFPQRVHLLGRSVLLRSLGGSRLDFKPSGASVWHERDLDYAKGIELFNHNSRRLETALADFVPGFFEAHD